MNRRILAVLTALVLAALGTVVLTAYVRGADERALAGARTRDVLVVTTDVPAGTPASDLADMVALKPVPAAVVATGSIAQLSDLGDDLSGLVTTVALEKGEQLLKARVAAPASLAAPGTVPVPAGKSEVSVLLDPARAVGGRLAAGDSVGVFVSLQLPDGTSTTHAVLHRVLVTEVQGAPPAASPAAKDTAGDGATAPAAPSASVMVTLAVDSADAEVLLFGSEHGTVWLSREPGDADVAGTKVVTEGNVYTGGAS